MRALIEGAGARGLRRMEGFVLAENDRMLALARRWASPCRPIRVT